jgi:hypothetical protein
VTKYGGTFPSVDVRAVLTEQTRAGVWINFVVAGYPAIVKA